MDERGEGRKIDVLREMSAPRSLSMLKWHDVSSHVMREREIVGVNIDPVFRKKGGLRKRTKRRRRETRRIYIYDLTSGASMTKSDVGLLIAFREC